MQRCLLELISAASRKTTPEAARRAARRPRAQSRYHQTSVCEPTSASDCDAAALENLARSCRPDPASSPRRSTRFRSPSVGSTLAANSTRLAAAVAARELQVVKALQIRSRDMSPARSVCCDFSASSCARLPAAAACRFAFRSLRAGERRVDLVLRQIERLDDRLADVQQALRRPDRPTDTAPAPA